MASIWERGVGGGGFHSLTSGLESGLERSEAFLPPLMLWCPPFSSLCFALGPREMQAPVPAPSPLSVQQKEPFKTANTHHLFGSNPPCVTKWHCWGYASDLASCCHHSQPDISPAGNLPTWHKTSWLRC